MPRRFALLPALLLATAVAPAPAVTIDFEEFSDGETVAAPLAAHDGYTLLANSFRGPDVALVHDTSPEQPSDVNEPDPISDGGPGLITKGAPIRRDEDLGNVLVLSDPSGGELTFALHELANTLSFDWIPLGGPIGTGEVRLFPLQNGVVEVGLSEGGGSGPVHHMFVGASNPSTSSSSSSSARSASTTSRPMASSRFPNPPARRCSASASRRSRSPAGSGADPGSPRPFARGRSIA